MDAINKAMLRILSGANLMTVRQVFYNLTTTGLIAKTKMEYRATVCRLLGDLRRDGSLPYDAEASEQKHLSHLARITGGTA